MNKQKDLLGKGITLLFMSSFFLQQAEPFLKATKWFKQENKHLMNMLLSKNVPIIEAEERLVKLLSDEQELKEKKILDGFNGDGEDITYMYNNEKLLFINLMKIFIQGTDEQIASASFDLQQLSEGKKLFTYDAMKAALKRFASTSPVLYTDEYLESFLKEYE